MVNKYKIGIVEDESEFRKYIEEILESFSDMIMWGSGEDCFHDKRVGELDILLLDIGLPHMNGIDLLKKLKPKYPHLKILMLSGINSDEMIFNALKFGASGYIWKSEIKHLKDSIQIIIEDGSFMSPTIGVRVLHYFRSKVETNIETALTTRERQILELIISGLKVQNISDQLAISISTTRKHIENIYTKLQVSNRVELMKKANEMGYLN
ncbi:MAG: response regulator transcription factor [Leptospiraceae bacterium]|nr:response regulator transcription factor [Leptospiraceae bacterium]